MADDDSDAYRPLSFDRATMLGTRNLSLQPYDYTVAAKDDLKETYHALLCEIRELDDDAPLDGLNSRLAAVCYQLGRVYYDLAGPRDALLAESMFLAARSAVRGREACADNVLSAINALNMLALIRTKRDRDPVRAVRYVLEADAAYRAHGRLPDAAAGPPTPVARLLSECSTANRAPPRPRDAALHAPLASARAFTLLYAIDAYMDAGLAADALSRAHAALRFQRDNGVYLRGPLDWALSCAMAAQLFAEHNAYRQARHHLAAASAFLEIEIPHKYRGGGPKDSDIYRKYSADISYCWARYGLRLLKKSKSKLVKQKTHKQPPSLFDDLFFNNFDLLDEERVTDSYVDTYEEAQSLASHVLICLNRTKLHYSFEKTATHYASLCMDKYETYKLLSYFQDDPDKMGKLFKKGIVDMEFTVNRLDKENYSSICRRMWYELGTVYSDMMDIKYERHVRNKAELTENAAKKINYYSSSSIKYYSRFIESFYVEKKLPKHLDELYIKPVLLAHLHIARCNNRKIVNTKKVKLEILLQCKQYYKTVVNYCETDPITEDLIPIELASCKELLLAIPSKMEHVVKTREPVKYYI